MVVGSRKTTGIRAAVILYSAWIVFYLACHYFGFFSLPALSSVFSFMAAALFALLIVSSCIEELRYSPFILIIVFALGGRLIAFIGDYISMLVIGKVMFMLPFGSIDFYLFNLLILGFFRYAAFSAGSSGKKSFHIVSLIPLMLFSAPVLLNLLSEGLTAVTVYSFVFTTMAALTMGACISFTMNYPRKRWFAIAAGAAVIADMLIYFELSPLSGHLPPGLGNLLLPYALFMLTDAAARIKKDDIYD